MDAMQQLGLASGIAVGGGLLGAAVSWILHERRLTREAQRLGNALDCDAGLAATPSNLRALSPLLDALSQRLDAMRQRGDEADAHRRQMSAEMVLLMNQTDGATRAKDRFLAAANHDLRQPLQAMDLALDQLRREALPAQAKDIEHMRAGMRTMTDVLDGLLLLSQLDAGSLHAQAAPCDLQGLFAELLTAQGSAAVAAGVAVHMRAGGHVVFTDCGVLCGLLARLLDNAINACPRGGRVLLAARRRGGDIRIEIRDNGIGIAPVHQPRVFDEFFQVGNSERDHRKGFGLGLPVVSRLAALLGTRVELDSRLHAGSCFWLRLPRASASVRAPRALLLDPDPLQRDALAAMLGSWGYAVHAEAALDGAAARLNGSNGPFDAVLCAIDGAADPAWRLLHDAATRHAQAARIVLCHAPSPELLEIAARHGAQSLMRPLAPAKLRALLAMRAAVRPPAASRGGP